MPLTVNDPGARIDGRTLHIEVPIPVFNICTRCQCPADTVIIHRQVFSNNAVVTVELQCHHCRENMQEAAQV